jgi:hypothetical protein
MATSPYEINFTDYRLKDMLAISIKITHVDELIYDSKTSMNRDFIVFNNDKEVLSKDCSPGLYILYAPNLDSLLKYPDDIHCIKTDIYSFESEEGDVIQSNTRTLFFINEKSCFELYFVAKEINNVFFRYEDEEYKVVDGDLFVDVESDVDIRDYGIRHNEDVLRLSNLKFANINSKKRYLISSLMDEGAIGKFYIFKYSDNSIVCGINIIKFNVIKVIYDKCLYYDKNDNGEVHFITNKYNLKANFTLCNKEITIKFNCGEIVLQPPTLRWKIDNGEWEIKSMISPLWYKKLSNSSILHIDIPKNLSCIVALTNNTIIESTNQCNKFKLGQTIHSLKAQNMILNDHIQVILNINNEYYPLMIIYLMETIIGNPFCVMSEEKLVVWSPEYFIGDSSANLRLDITDVKKIYESRKLPMSYAKLDFSNCKENNYRLKVMLVEEGLVNRERLLYSKNVTIGNEKKIRFKSKKIMICSIMLVNDLFVTNIRKVNIDRLQFEYSINGIDFYSGYLSVESDGNRKYLNSIRDACGKLIVVNPVRVGIKDKKSCYISYGFNPADKTLMHKKEFTIDRYGNLSVDPPTSCYSVDRIDYYIYEVKNNA